MFDIDENLISSYGYGESYEKGINYYLDNKVHQIDVAIENKTNFKKITISAKVNSDSSFFKEYDVKVYFTSYSTSIHGVCDCKSYPRSYTQGNMCEHIIAVLFKYCREKREILKTKNTKINNSLFNQIKDSFSTVKFKTESKLLNVDLKIESEGLNSSLLSLELKVGFGRLYVVKDIKEFIKSILNNECMEFGKNFTFNPSLHKFSEEDKKILNILFDIYDIDKTSQYLAGFKENNSKFIVGKKVYLSENYIKKLFHVLENRKFELIMSGDKFTDVLVIKEDFPLEFKIETEHSEITLYQSSPLAIPITNNSNFFFYNSNIYLPSYNQLKTYKPFYDIFIKKGENKINFHEEEISNIASFIIPSLNKISRKLIIDKNIEENLYQEPLKAIIYFDKDHELITATVIFKYGEIEFNALKYKEDKPISKALVRDISSEYEIINTLVNFGFKENSYNFVIQDEEKLLNFMINGKDMLEELSDIYYSEEFKSIKVYTPKNYRSAVRLNNEDLLEFSFDIEGIDKRELKNIFDAIKQKKKYYRLKNGGFVPLTSDKLLHIADMIDYLNLGNSDLQKDKMLLSKYNAIYIDTNLGENNIDFVERNNSFRDLVNNIKDITELDYSLPDNLNNVMRDYQKFGLKWLKTLSSCGFGGILSDEMGLGKTLQTIAFIKSEIVENSTKIPTLVVCPTSLVYNWADEIKKFQSDLKCLVISGSKNEREAQRTEINEADIVITSYALIRRDIDEYKDIKFRYCFLDEAQNIKNPDSLNTRSVKNIKANGYFALTGTPIENSLTELWSIFDFIMPGYLLSHRKFTQKYEIPIIKKNNSKALEALSNHIRPFILRRLKKDVIKELPPKIEHNVTIDMTDEQKKVYAAFLAKAREELDVEIQYKGFNKSKIKILSILTRLRQICCDPSTFIEDYKGENGKLEVLLNIVENNINAGHKILIFSQFTSVLKNIAKKFIEENINYMYLDGTIKSADRSILVKEFNEGDAPIFLISLKAGGTGLNLTSADIVIHYDPWWNPAVEDQASDRAHRIGQKNTVEVIKLIAKGTIEEKIYSIQEKKKEMVRNVISESSNQDMLISGMSEDDLLKLFK